MFNGLTPDQWITAFVIFLCIVATITFVVFLFSGKSRRHR
ncbi:hypothetical protein B5T_03150 [Alloalcanivorax dieselolei B5]|uniref:Uncharacterized protein n=1 Tax=Alcanivorax dieselolei (strain DSM 16502 / CGMCC 1.3690 / MCCC 1A00001 / B-5) TaxID=930169 RepID=K0CI58_ALCDB|nr:hypothetical protein B5T_03150 [Alloalcanivorax dieselolei B5]GGK08148.1 hypothetical protein GCM10007426_40490 [Alloalcanivorax dieselolei]